MDGLFLPTVASLEKNFVSCLTLALFNWKSVYIQPVILYNSGCHLTLEHYQW